MNTQQEINEVDVVRPVVEPHRQEFARDSKMVLVEIDSKPAMSALPNGVVVTQGTSRYYIRAMDLAIAQSQVMTEQDHHEYAVAAEQYVRDLEHKIATDLVMEQLVKNGGPQLEIEKLRHEIIRTDSNSIEATVHRLFPNTTLGWHPFKSLKVIEQDITNPRDAARLADEAERLERERAARTEESAASAGVVAAAVSAALQPVVTLILEQMKQQNTTKKG